MRINAWWMVSAVLMLYAIVGRAYGDEFNNTIFVLVASIPPAIWGGYK